ncbi:MAG: hypothetical protein LBO62_04540 [Endomicrobium sp.]|jgi:hypothetical protein|nr:hypothetical protein [Endomicrobium sp.]
MLKRKQTDDCICDIYKQLGKICVASLFAGLVFVFFAAYKKRDSYEDYQERLRNAYEGLSPEEY